MAIIGSASFEPWTGGTGDEGAISFEAWTAEASILNSEPTSAALLLEAWTASASLSANTVLVTGEASFEKWTASARFGLIGDAELEPWTATARIRTPMVGAASWEPWFRNAVAGAPSLEMWAASAVLRPGVPETYFVAAVNTRSKGVTEYTNFPFNSFAKVNGQWYAAGPGGLYLLGSADDDGTGIAWVLRTGQMDDKEPGLKRLPEVLLALRSNGPVKVRVYPDDNTFYDYVLPAVKKNTIHQHRVRPGKGMRSRYYSVELQGVGGSDLELDSMQVNMTKTGRRLG